MSASPKQIASALEAISAGIRRASKPSAKKVSADLQCVVAALGGDASAAERVARIASAFQASTEKVGETASAALPSRSDVAAYLEAMADGIDKAKSPSASRVSSDLRCLLAALEGQPVASERVVKVASARKA